jgi:hypothetical protein
MPGSAVELWTLCAGVDPRLDQFAK